MKRFLFSAMPVLLLSQNALAQAPAEEGLPPAVSDPAAPPVAPAESFAPPAEPVAAPAATADAPAAADAAAAPSPVSVSVFADSYYGWQTDKIGAGQPWHAAYSRTNGFGLSFFGADLVYDAGEFGATSSLRFGPSVPIFYGGNTSDLGIENILQAYGTWKPSDTFSLDFGQFGTIYGAEVAESWKNLNYTRGGLYFGMQPFWHTGARARVSLAEGLGLTAMVVNGVNSVIDVNKGRPSIGAQLSYATDTFGVIVGYLGATDREAEMFDHFVDVVATLNLGDFSLVLNGDFNINQKRSETDENMVTTALDDAKFWGISAAAGYNIGQHFQVAVRGEYLNDADNSLYVVDAADSVNVATGTLTLSWYPAATRNLIIRWDNRFERSSEKIYFDRDDAATDVWFQSVLGFVVTSSL